MARGHQLRTSLNLNLSQRLAMTPSLLQKIELLTLNRLELSDLLNQELAENPVLEEVSQQTDGEDSEKQDEEKGKDEGEDAYDDFDYEYFFGEYLSPAPRSRAWENHSELPSFELFLASWCSSSVLTCPPARRKLSTISCLCRVILRPLLLRYFANTSSSS